MYQGGIFMRNLDDRLRKRKINYKALEKYGFQKAVK